MKTVEKFTYTESMWASGRLPRNGAVSMQRRLSVCRGRHLQWLVQKPGGFPAEPAQSLGSKKTRPADSAQASAAQFFGSTSHQK